MVLQIIAHRGASNEAPENTLPAFERAVSLGAAAIECDIRMSADGVPMVFHDETLERTTNAPSGQLLNSLTLAQLQTLDAGSWHPKYRKPTKIPALADLLALPRGDLFLMLEFKEGGDAIDAVLSLIAGHARVLVGSRHMDIVAELVQRGCGDQVIAIPDTPETLQRALELGVKWLAVHHGIVPIVPVSECHAKGITIWVWTVDRADEALALQALGIDGVITNTPEAFLSAISSFLK